MRPSGSSNSDGARRPWQPPTIAKLAIGAETKTAAGAAQGGGTSVPAHPEPPAAPASKLGFSLEMAFPLSARVEG